MALMLCYIPVSNTLPAKTAAINSFPPVIDKIKMFEMPVKATGNQGTQLKLNAEYMRDITAMKANRKVSLLTPAFEKLHSTGNHMPTASARNFTAAPGIATIVVAPAAAAQDIIIARPAATAPAQAEVKPEPETAEAKIRAGHKDLPSLLTRIRHQFTQIWSSLKRSVSSLVQTYRLQKNENVMQFENLSRNKSQAHDAMNEINNAYQQNPLRALSLYNAAKQNIIFDAINDIIETAKRENADVDIHRLCEQANHYALNSGVNSLLFTVTENNTIRRANICGLPSMQQRTRQLQEVINNIEESSATLHRSSQNLNRRQRANSVQSIAQRMINAGYAKLFNDVQSDKKNLYGTRHHFDKNEMRAALLEGQPALKGYDIRSAA